MAMRLGLLLVATCIVGPALAADRIWTGREGLCSDWNVTWHMTTRDQVGYVGTVELVHEGGKCAAASGAQVTGTVQADIQDAADTAVTKHSNAAITAVVKRSDGNACSYSGTLSGNKVTGVQNCPGAKNTPWIMTIVR